MSSIIYRRGGAVYGQKSYKPTYENEPRAHGPKNPCDDCNSSDSDSDSDSCHRSEHKSCKGKRCESCHNRCYPCKKPYIINCVSGEGCDSVDLCVVPPKCLLADELCRSLYCELKKTIIFYRIDLLLQDLTELTYPNLVNIALELADRVPDSSGRVVITLPDGTVVVDTNTTNTWASFMAKTINENHNSRVAIFNAQDRQTGVGYEEKYSTSTQCREKYVAIRLGEYLDNYGTIRLSKKLICPSNP